jgi:L-amino acid N-acyltransferase YncA
LASATDADCGRESTSPLLPPVELRPLAPTDWPLFADIYWDGLRDGLATFESEVPSWERWDQTHHRNHRLVADRLGDVVGWAALSAASRRRCYAGVAEDSIYVDRAVRGLGIGRVLLDRLVEGADAAGIWTIQTSIFPENRASLALHERCGFRIVGVRERIARRDGVWRDTVFLERRSAVVA